MISSRILLLKKKHKELSIKTNSQGITQTIGTMTTRITESRNLYSLWKLEKDQWILDSGDSQNVTKIYT